MEMSDAINGLIGGGLIGLAASIILLINGKIFGISGILSGALQPASPDFCWRLASLLGIIVGGFLLTMIYPAAFENEMVVNPMMAGVAGIIVGFGTKIGRGCTSGHGICGVSRFSTRSITATCTFIVTGAITVYIFGMIGR